MNILRIVVTPNICCQRNIGLAFECFTTNHLNYDFTQLLLRLEDLPTNRGDVIVWRHLVSWLDGVQELLEAVTTHNAQWTKISCHELGYQPSNCGSAFSRTIVGSVICFFEEDGPPKECVYSFVCFADKCEAKLVMPPPWTSCIPHNLHHTFTTSFPFSLFATDASKYSQTGLVRFLVDIWSIQGSTPASSYSIPNK